MTTLADLRAVADAVDAGADIITRIADALEKLVNKGLEILHITLARRTRNRLVDILARSSQLGGVQRIVIIDAISSYLDHPSAENWTHLQEGVKTVFVSVADLIKDLEKDRSDFVVESVRDYQRFFDALHGRMSVLEKLSRLPEPSTPEELDNLESIGEKYKALLAALRRANDALSEYLLKFDRA